MIIGQFERRIESVESNNMSVTMFDVRYMIVYAAALQYQYTYLSIVIIVCNESRIHGYFTRVLAAR